MGFEDNKNNFEYYQTYPVIVSNCITNRPQIIDS